MIGALAVVGALIGPTHAVTKTAGSTQGGHILQSDAGRPAHAKAQRTSTVVSSGLRVIHPAKPAAQSQVVITVKSLEHGRISELTVEHFRKGKWRRAPKTVGWLHGIRKGIGTYGTWFPVAGSKGTVGRAQFLAPKDKNRYRVVSQHQGKRVVTKPFTIRSTRAVPARANWSDISVGQGAFCGVRTDGTLWCWGDGHGNYPDILGAGSKNVQPVSLQSMAPLQIGRDRDWRSVSVGGDHACALKADKTAWCWGIVGSLGDGRAPQTLGYRYKGQIIRAAYRRTQATPVRVSGGSWQALTVGNGFTCGLREGGAAWCWGETNDLGQLGNGTYKRSLRPAAVKTAIRFTSLNHSEGRVCGVSAEHTAWCWGSNMTDVPKPGSKDDCGNSWCWVKGPSAPVQVSASPVWRSGQAHAPDSLWCGVRLDGSFTCDQPVELEDPEAWFLQHVGWESFEISEDVGCGLKSDGSLWCMRTNMCSIFGTDCEVWSPEFDEQLARVEASKPWTKLSIERPWAQVSYGVRCGIQTDGSAWCWGDSRSSGRGSPNMGNRRQPAQVVG